MEETNEYSRNLMLIKKPNDESEHIIVISSKPTNQLPEEFDKKDDSVYNHICYVLHDTPNDWKYFIDDIALKIISGKYDQQNLLDIVFKAGYLSSYNAIENLFNWLVWMGKYESALAFVKSTNNTGLGLNVTLFKISDSFDKISTRSKVLYDKEANIRVQPEELTIGDLTRFAKLKRKKIAETNKKIDKVFQIIGENFDNIIVVAAKYGLIDSCCKKKRLVELIGYKNLLNSCKGELIDKLINNRRFNEALKVADALNIKETLFYVIDKKGIMNPLYKNDKYIFRRIQCHHEIKSK